MDGFQKAIAVLPPALQETLNGIPDYEKRRVQEIRLRAGQPVMLTAAGQTLVTEAVCREEWVWQLFDTLCECSVYAHQEELRRGFVTARNGCRIGVAGTAVVENGNIVSYRQITSLCVRVARRHEGCATSLAERVTVDGRVHGLLICGEPSCGKTSLLKDLIREFSCRGISAAVVDERGELSQGESLWGCDVLLYAPKPAGVEQAVRCLAPQVIVLDELGDAAEIDAVMDGVYRGVSTVATVHCRTPDQLLQRPALKRALENGGFEYLCFLKGRETPGRIETVMRTEEWLREVVGSGFYGALRDGDRSGKIPAIAATGHRVATVFKGDVLHK